MKRQNGTEKCLADKIFQRWLIECRQWGMRKIRTVDDAIEIKSKRWKLWSENRLGRQYRGFPFRRVEFEVLGRCSSDSTGWKKFC